MIEFLWFYTKLGFWHVVDWEGLDHFYFIITMAIPFTFVQWRKLLWWVTIFTIGHTKVRRKIFKSLVPKFSNFY